TPFESFAPAEEHALAGGDADFEAGRDTACAFHEVLGDLIAEQIPRGLFEELEPAIEVPRFNWERQVHAHGLAVVDATRQHDGRPEVAHALQVRLPVGDAVVEDGT